MSLEKKLVSLINYSIIIVEEDEENCLCDINADPLLIIVNKSVSQELHTNSGLQFIFASSAKEKLIESEKNFSCTTCSVRSVDDGRQ